MSKIEKLITGLSSDSVVLVLDDLEKRFPIVERDSDLIVWKLQWFPRFRKFVGLANVDVSINDFASRCEIRVWFDFWWKVYQDYSTVFSIMFSKASGISLVSSPDKGGVSIRLWSSEGNPATFLANAIDRLGFDKLISIEKTGGKGYVYKIEDRVSARRDTHLVDAFCVRVGNEDRSEGESKANFIRLIQIPFADFGGYMERISEWAAEARVKKVEGLSVACAYEELPMVGRILSERWSGPWRFESFCKGREIALSDISSVKPGEVFPLKSYALGRGIGLVVDIVGEDGPTFGLYVQSTDNVSKANVAKISEAIAV